MKAENEKKDNDQRRFQRVHFRRDYGAADRITKAYIHWRNLEVSDVFDLSLGGLAASKPSMQEFIENRLVDFTLELGTSSGVWVTAKVAWVRDFSVGFSFVRLDPQGHLALRKFLNEKLIGSHLRLMRKEIYSKRTDFDLWYSAPNNTHLSLKFVDSQELPRKIAQAEVIIDGERLLFAQDEITQGVELKDRLIQILTHAPEDQVAVQTFLEQILGRS